MTRTVLILFTFLFFISYSYSQPRGRGKTSGGSIKGKVVDRDKQTLLEYANIKLYSQSDKSLVTGAISKKDGNFELNDIKFGKYYIEVKYIGYHLKKIDNIDIKQSKRNTDLGTIQLKEATLELKGVQVEAEKPAVEYKIDKKVINVSKHYTAVSGTAVDVLENVPSVSIDIEGNVSLRGSSSFMVLIDDRPTVLDANDALNQIPANSIETIEIITNPSAKYDPDGTSGIINIITKKQKLHGTSGIVNINTGLDEKYGADFLLNYRNDRFNLFAGADYNYRLSPGTSRSENETTEDDITSFIYSDGSSKSIRNTYGLRGGFNFNISDNDLLNFESRYGRHERAGSNNLNYQSWTDLETTPSIYSSRDKWERGGSYYSFDMNYNHNFGSKEHKLTFQINYRFRDGNEESSNRLIDSIDQNVSGRRTTEDGPSTRAIFKLDYTLPVNSNDRFEAGYQTRFGISEDITDLYDLDVLSSNYILQPEFSHSIEYHRDIHSLYSMYSGELGQFGYQGGLRGEYTDREIILKDESENYKSERWDYFPTAHISYSFSSEQQMMASYTRRIERPRSWYLEPFETWTDAYNVRMGNPELEPEYIDSYELGFQKYFGKDFITLETYYRVTHNRIERVRSVYDENIILHSTQNVGTDYALGTELMFNSDLFDFWNISIMTNAYNYRIESELFGDSLTQESFNWRLRLNNTFKIGEDTRIQLNGTYRSPTASSQGRREGYFSSNIAVRQDFFNKMLSATLQIRDVFGSEKREGISEGTSFYIYSYSQRKSPTIMLTLTYNFNNYETEQERNGGNDQEDDF